MTLLDLFALLDRHPFPVLAHGIGLPALAFAVSHYRDAVPLESSPVRWLYSAILYAVCLPGLVATVAIADVVTHGGLLEVGLLSQLLPLLSMLATLALFRRLPNPEAIPGFRRLTGFIWVLILTALALSLLMRTRIWILFGGGIGTLLLLMGGLFLTLKWAFDRAFGRDR